MNKWTSEIPSVPGFYFIRFGKRGNYDLRFLTQYELDHKKQTKKDPIEARMNHYDYLRNHYPEAAKEVLNNDLSDYIHYFQGPILPNSEYENPLDKQ